MSLRTRALAITCFLAVGFTVVSLRLVQIQIMDGDKFHQEAIHNHFERVDVPPTRGMILDSHGTILAKTHVLYDVRLDGKELKNPDQTLPLLSKILEIPLSNLKAVYNPEKRFELLKTGLTEETVSALKDLKLKSLIFERKAFRAYPNSGHASHVIGFVDGQNIGVMGVERQMNKELRGVAGERWIERDVRKREIAAYRRKDVRAVDGMNVQLTLDLGIQHVVEESLNRVMEKSKANAAYAIVMRPKTGEILAMANRPTFDPNIRVGMDMSRLRNRCLTDVVEPGSTFKIVTLSGILQEGLMTLQTQIFCENGSFYFGGKWLHDDEENGVLSVEDILARSSNIGFCKMGLALGDERLYTYAKQFGFGSSTGMMPGQGESAGILNPLHRWTKVSISRVPMGHEIGVTPIQMVSAYAAIANGGRLMEPRLIHQITDNQGRILRAYPPHVIRQVIQEKTARTVSDALTRVLSAEGTGKRANVPGFTVAGKTGTAQKVINGTYSKEKYLASFIGYLPQENPEFVVLVMVDEPKGREYHGGQVAAPAFAEMSTQIAQALNLVPRSAPATKVGAL
jgi:cell division protein FtsI (penicillin-binding protein 3)/stage V sporulation protein D (sporulation-specific penicillin-binding protein)